MKKKNYGLDIFELLSALDRRDKEYWYALSNEEKAKFVPYLVMRWMSAVSDSSGYSDYYLVMVNEVVNLGLWDLAKFHELQFLLLSCIGTGQKQRHQWIEIPKKRPRTSALDELLTAYVPGMSDEELELIKNINTWDDIEELCLKYGYDDKRIKSVKTEFDQRT